MHHSVIQSAHKLLTPHMPNRRASATLSKDTLDGAAQALQQLPDKPKHQLSLREAIAQMSDSIHAALDRGYNHEEVAGFLKQQGIEVSATTLKSYLSQQRSQTPTPGTRRGRRPKQTDAPEEVAALAKLSVGIVDADTPTAKTRKPRQSAAQKPKATTQAVAAEPKTGRTAVRGRGRKSAP